MALLINILVGLATVLLGGRWTPHPNPNAVKVYLNTVGVVWMTVSVAAVLLPPLFGRELHWPVWILALLVVGVLGMATLQQLETRVDRVGGVPPLSPSPLQYHTSMTGLTASALHYIGVMASFLVLTLYPQDGRQLSAVYMGVTILLLAITPLITPQVASALVWRYGIRALSAGFGLMALGPLVLPAGFGTEWVHSAASSMMRAGIAMTLYGVGQGLVVVPLVGLVLTDIACMQTSVTARLLITVQQLAGVLDVARIDGLHLTFAAVGSANGMAHGTMVGCIAMLAALGAAAVDFVRLGVQQRRPAATSAASPVRAVPLNYFRHSILGHTTQVHPCVLINRSSDSTLPRNAPGITRFLPI